MLRESDQRDQDAGEDQEEPQKLADSRVNVEAQNGERIGARIGAVNETVKSEERRTLRSDVAKRRMDREDYEEPGAYDPDVGLDAARRAEWRWRYRVLPMLVATTTPAAWRDFCDAMGSAPYSYAELADIVNERWTVDQHGMPALKATLADIERRRDALRSGDKSVLMATVTRTDRNSGRVSHGRETEAQGFTRLDREEIDARWKAREEWKESKERADAVIIWRAARSFAWKSSVLGNDVAARKAAALKTLALSREVSVDLGPNRLAAASSTTDAAGVKVSQLAALVPAQVIGATRIDAATRARWAREYGCTIDEKELIPIYGEPTKLDRRTFDEAIEELEARNTVAEHKRKKRRIGRPRGKVRIEPSVGEGILVAEARQARSVVSEIVAKAVEVRPFKIRKIEEVAASKLATHDAYDDDASLVPLEELGHVSTLSPAYLSEKWGSSGRRVPPAKGSDVMK